MKERKKDIERRIKIRLEERQKKQEITEQEASYVWTDIHKYTEEKTASVKNWHSGRWKNRKIKETVWLIQKKFPNGGFIPMELIVFVHFCYFPIIYVSKPWII